MYFQDIADNPIVSFIVPVYKVEPKYLRECLDSIVAQTVKNIEIICVNNASPDDSGKILTEYASHDFRFKVITLKENRKTAGGRNAAYEFIRGKYVQFVDCDDTVSPILCERAVTEAEQTNADVVVFDYYCADNDRGPYYPAKVLESCFDMDSPEGYRIFTCYTLVWDRLWRTEFLLSNKLYFPEGVFCEDIWLVWQALVCGGKFVRIPDILYTWRYRSTSVTRSMPASYLDIIPMLGRIKEMLNNLQCYEKYQSAFQYIQALLIHHEYWKISSKYPGMLPRVEKDLQPIAEEIYTYLADEHCDFARILPGIYRHTKQFLQNVLRIPIPFKTKVRQKIKAMLRPLFQPFRWIIHTCFNFIGGVRIRRIEGHINTIQSYQHYLLEQQRRENNSLHRDILKLTAELKMLQEQ